MKLIPDDPIVACIERSGYPPWMQDGGDSDDNYEEDDLDDMKGENNVSEPPEHDL